MPTVSITFEFQAYRFDAPPITDNEFLTPLAIAAGRSRRRGPGRSDGGWAGGRIVTARSPHPVSDIDFDGWVAASCGAVARFLNGRPIGA